MPVITNSLELFQAAFPLIGIEVPSSADDQTPEMKMALSNYEIVVKEALSRHAWSWATKSDKLVYRGETNAQPLFAYTLPSDVVTPRSVQLGGQRFRDFEMRSNELLCGLKDSDQLVMVYTFRAGEDEWPADFVDAMVKRLASRLATGLIDRPQQGQQLDNEAERSLRRAMRRDRRTYQGPEVTPDPVLVEAWHGVRRSNRTQYASSS